ncbi:ricin-type beta-trefoil lectin domain protein [Kitasatospora sp. NBC_00240]|uniref:ricin-type beta-trefoil lectin domain protein n=1 Tax=Kitasatospora sp. NBC_00240 TaxID=2903567 RepID=UPI002254C71D|nr:ricin-type beta-trefoil lectin domain protein [Kitasatospora sp. NBC_00240]MCX5214142.1 ricin-type beta-trefoil lectin domain protein [Kitasatospora sp. NBC_00240]
MTPWLTRTVVKALALGLALAYLALAGPAALGRPAAGPAGQHAALDAEQAAAPPPPMGWASWNSFASSIDLATVKAQVDAFVAAGLPAAGYRYVNLDDGWWQGARDADGEMTVDPTRWPGGMAAAADYIHGKGLKAGIYTDAGRDGCGYYYPTTRPAAPGTGMEGHELQDAVRFQRWGFDFLKVDWCGGDAEHLDPERTYRGVAAAIAGATTATGRPMLLSVCEWGVGRPWNWAAGTAAMWRTGYDIIHWGERPSAGAVLANFDRSLHPAAQHTGSVNDPDMLTAGMDGLTDAQNRTQLSLWAIAGAPLLAGNDLTRMTAATKATLTNAEMIAIDQDARGLQGVKVAEDSAGLQVYGKVLSGTGRRAVVLLNRTAAAAPVTVRWTDLGLTGAPTAVREVWAAADRGAPATGWTANVPASGSVLLTVSGTEAPGSAYEAEAGTGGAACASCSGGAAAGPLGNGAALTLTGVEAATAGIALADIAYVNGDPVARTATLRVNGQAPTVVSFPPTGSWTTPGTVSVLLSLAKGATNTLGFDSPSAPGPALDAVRLRPLPGTAGTALVAAGSDRCAELPGNAVADGTRAVLADCTGGQNQTFTATPRGELVVYGNRCLAALDDGDGIAVDIRDCNGTAGQAWSAHPDGTLRNGLAGACLDARGSTAAGTPLGLWSCDGTAGQRWRLV